MCAKRKLRNPIDPSGSVRSGGSGRTGTSVRGTNSDPTTSFDPNNPQPDMWKHNPYFGFLGGYTAGGDLSDFAGGSSDLDHIRNLFQSLLNGNTNAAQLLAALLQGSNRADWSDESYTMIMQYLFSLMSTSDQRAYDWTMLQDSRQYNNPTNELARLMGAGISRDAALQILSGSAGNAGGVGSAGSLASVPTPTGTDGQLQLQRDAFVRDTVISGISAIMGIVQGGVGIAQGVEQVKTLQAQNYWNQQQISAYDSVNQLTQGLQALQASGQIESSEIERLSNANDLIKFLQDKAKDNEQIAQLVNSKPYLTALGTNYGREYLNQYWKSQRDSRDAGTILDEYIRGQKLQNDVTALQPTKIAAEMANIGKQNDLIDQQIIESCNRIAVGEANIQVLNEQGNYIRVQSNKAESEIDYLRAQIEGQNISNKSLNLNYEYNAAGFPMLKQNRIDQLTQEAMKWSTLLRDPQYSKNMIWQMQRRWLLEYENAADAAYVMNLYYNAVGNFATDHPGIYALGSVFKSTGLADMLKFSAGAVSAAATSFPVVP